MIYRNKVKRVIDILISLLIIIVMFPIFVIAAVLIKMSSPGPVFFYQSRIGLFEKPFRLVKLRTMTVNPSRPISQTTNADPEVFYVGKILRRLKLDELPQILNVFKGDMSLVGPRPCLEETREEMPDWAKARFKTRPGLTGLAQVNGNIALTWEERWRYDTKYLNDISLINDFSILLKTFLIVILGEERFKKEL